MSERMMFKDVIYTGEFKKDENGIYFGKIKDGNKVGKGIMQYEKKRKKKLYYGLWKNNMRHGYGIMEYKDGSRYEGNYKEGKKDGYGKVKHVNGDVYEGKWKKGKKVGYGYGSRTFSLNNWYKGEFKDELYHGYGTLLNDVSVYEGEWKNGKMHGYGKITYYDNVTYEGDWEGGLPYGYGKMINPNGHTEIGWHFDILKDGFEKFPNGNMERIKRDDSNDSDLWVYGDDR